MTHWYLGDTGDVRNQLCLQIAPLPSPRDLPSRQRAFADGVDCPVCLDRMPSPPPAPSWGSRLWRWLTGGQRAA